MMPPMQITSLWRYPVKSLQGESLDTAAVEADGLHGDRRWGIRDEETGRILTARREPSLLLASSTLDRDGVPAVHLPDGTVAHGTGPSTDEALSDWLGRRVRLVGADAVGEGRAEFFADPTDDTSQAIEWSMPASRFVDLMPLLLLTTASLRTAEGLHADGTWDPRRFRANVLIDADGDGWPEDEWCGRTVVAGDVTLRPDAPCVRCTMVTRPQPGLERDLDIYRTLSRHHGGTFGVWTKVAATGTLRVGDAVALTED